MGTRPDCHRANHKRSFHAEVSNHSNGRTRTTRETRYLHVLPENLDINGTVIPETRYRGIYESVVYKSRLRLSGNFLPPDWDRTRVPKENILTEKAWLTIGISDARGIRENSKILFDGKELETLPGLPTQEVISTGVMATIDLSEINASTDFVIDLHLDGSSTLAFSPSERRLRSPLYLHGRLPVSTEPFFPLTRNWAMMASRQIGKSFT